MTESEFTEILSGIYRPEIIKLLWDNRPHSNWTREEILANVEKNRTHPVYSTWHVTKH